MGSGVELGEASAGIEGAGSVVSASSVSVGGCLRFSDLSFARRAFRSAAAASREAWEVITAVEVLLARWSVLESNVEEMLGPWFRERCDWPSTEWSIGHPLE